MLARGLDGLEEGIALFDEAPEGRELRLCSANRAFANALGRASEDLVGQSLTALIGQLEADAGFCEALTEGRRAEARALVGRPFRVALSPIASTNSSALHWLCVLRAEPADEQRLSGAVLLAAGLVHEINNPLASVTTNLEWLAAALPSVQKPQDPTRWNALSTLSSALVDALAGTERIEATLQQLNVLTGLEYPQRELLDVRVILDTALAELAADMADGVEIIREYADVPLIIAGERRLRLALGQLLSNALQALDAGSRERKVTLRVHGRSPVHIEIEDSGCGIPEPVRAELFRPFVTTKPLGVGKGLGLYLARSTIEGVGGRIAFSSLPAGGTRFSIELPSTGLDSEPPPSSQG